MVSIHESYRERYQTPSLGGFDFVRRSHIQYFNTAFHHPITLDELCGYSGTKNPSAEIGCQSLTMVCVEMRQDMNQVRMHEFGCIETVNDDVGQRQENQKGETEFKTYYKHMM
jgi:hypothetical protein